MIKLGAYLFAVLAAYGTAVQTQEMTLGDYLASIDRAEITFSGKIQYNERQDSFTFYDEDLGLFQVAVDAGREVREQIEEECRRGPLFSRTNACTISGSGTVEIRGAEIALSIATVDELIPTNPASSEVVEDEVAAALGAALGAAPTGSEGPPMTGSERNAFRAQVNSCWSVDAGSIAARVTVEVGFSLDRDGRVVDNEVRLLSSDGDQSATATAFESARRAILRCQDYQLPADKYDQWKEPVITFDPSGMRLR